ncbi:dienelactone hydrolase family protein [Lapidilactobacillus bayanensis]|uniref:dienelactone hydrolase family protein n=1 Tax=Lapidilactobacillus bayanensis TaxID=2485998 RepID=UPI000F79C22D|nr:dienelactone hydrolase family protein [Lapidilactobacillus bayanensis]
MPTRAELIELLGENANVTPTGQILFKQEFSKYTIETLSLQLNSLETVPGYFAYPNTGLSNYPLVIFNHSHGGNFQLGKQELIDGNCYLQEPSFLNTLIEMGYAVGCIDMWGFGERQGKKESELVKEFLLKGRTLWGMRIYDDQQFITYLLQRPEVAGDRIATIGMSMGGMMSWWLAALDSRVKLTVDIAGQVELQALIDERGLDHHGFYYYVPRLLTKFSTLSIQALIAPRYRLSLVGKSDNMCPIAGVELLNEQLTTIYQEKQAPDRWESLALTGGHQETSEMRKRWMNFMKRNL